MDQTRPTPFMQPPLVGELGYLAHSPAAEQIIAGTWETPEGTDQYSRELIKELKMPEAIQNKPPINLKISLEEHQRGWIKARANTGCDPTSLNFEHYKCAVFDNELS